MDGKSSQATEERASLDFSRLFGKPQGDKAAAGASGAAGTGERVYDSMPGRKNTPQTATEPEREEQSVSLFREAQKEKELGEMTSRICREYQANIRASDDLQAQILKGIKAGEDSYHLFLKAAKAISLMTSNPQFYSQVERDYRHLHGEIFHQREPLEDMLKETEERLAHLLKVAEAETDIFARDRLNRSITAHQERIEDLKGKIAGAE